MQGSPRVLVTGATGAVGPHLVSLLYQEGYQVCTLTRHEPNPALLPDRAEVFVGDITNRRDVQMAIKDCDAVIHLAALLHIVDPPDSLKPQYERVNIEGTHIVVEEAMRANVKRLIYFSTINVYGPTDGNVVTEISTPNPDTFYAATKLAAEKIILEARNVDSNPCGVVLRLGAVYGTRVKGNYYRLLHAMANGRFIPIGDGTNRRTLIYDKDVARAALLALQHPNAVGRIFNVTDNVFHTVSDIIEAMCTALGRKPPPFVLPVVPMRWTAAFLEDSAKFIGLKSPVTRSTIDKYTEDIAVDGTRIQRELDFTPTYDLDQGWREIVTEMRLSGDL